MQQCLEGVAVECTHLALITIFQRKFDRLRASSIYIFRVYSKHLEKEKKVHSVEV